MCVMRAKSEATSLYQSNHVDEWNWRGIASEPMSCQEKRSFPARRGPRECTELEKSRQSEARSRARSASEK